MEAILYSLLPLIIIFVIATIGRINNELHDRKYNLAKKIKEERLAREEQEKKKWDIYKKNLERKLKSKQESSRRLSISVNQKDLEDKLVNTIIKFISSDASLMNMYQMNSTNLLTVKDKIEFLERCLSLRHSIAKKKLDSRNQDIIREAKKVDLQKSLKSKNIHEEKALQGIDILNKEKPERFLFENHFKICIRNWTNC